MTKDDSTNAAHPQLKKTFKRRKMRRNHRFAFRRIIRRWPFLIWMTAVVALIYLYNRGTEFGGMSGTVETVEELVAPLETARLISVEVEIGQHLKRGDVVAIMDTSVIDAEIATAKAEQQEAQTSITGYQQNILKLVQQFNEAIKDAEKEILNVKTDHESDLAKLAVLKQEQERRELLAEKSLISMQDLSALRPEIAALEKIVSSYTNLLMIHQRRLNTARSEREDLKIWLRLKDDGVISDVLQEKKKAREAIIETRLAALDLQLKNHILTASRDGVVAQIGARPGDVVRAGQEIVRIVSEKSNRIIGFLPEVFLGNVNVGQNAVIWRDRDGKRMDAKVVSIAPDVRELPGRITPIRGQPCAEEE
ncbi:HlyD family efflux transporter periplasmic adaptor subunit [PVC group bacterium]|nr:HlyD family efflux transporter periplasmic adaptor subunit [PVC group bacterium]